MKGESDQEGCGGGTCCNAISLGAGAVRSELLKLEDNACLCHPVCSKSLALPRCVFVIDSQLILVLYSGSILEAALNSVGQVYCRVVNGIVNFTLYFEV